MNDIKYEISYLTGKIKLDPIKYILERQPDGSGKLSSEFMIMTGEWDAMVASAWVFAPYITIIEHEKYKKKWWKIWG